MKIISFFIGFLASFFLGLLYVSIMLLFTKSIQIAYEQFLAIWYFMVPLIIAFGVQIGLFAYMKQLLSSKVKEATALAATNTTTSAVGMIACCAHHLTDVMPLLGISALSVFLARYQGMIIVVAVTINVISIFYMIKKLRDLLS